MSSSRTAPPSTAADRDERDQRDGEDFDVTLPGGIGGRADGRGPDAVVMMRLPRLVRRALGMAWSTDRRSVAVLSACQAVTGLLSAATLFATTALITALITPAPLAERLRHAAPLLVLVSAAAGLRVLLGIIVTLISDRLSPRIARRAELTLLNAATSAELAAYERAGFTELWDSAERGIEVSKDLLTRVQQLITAAITLLAACVVLTVLYPLLLPLLVLTAVPQGMASVREAQVHYREAMETFADRRVLAVLRLFLVGKETAGQVRSDTVAPFLLGRYREAGDRVDRTNDRAAWRCARISLAGSLVSGLGFVVMWGSLVLLLASGRLSVAAAGTAVFALRTAATGLQGLVRNGAHLYRLGLNLDDCDRFVAQATDLRLTRGTLTPGPPGLIEVVDATYRYPGSHRQALDGVSLRVRRGEILAVVGENGGGKSTLMRLLAGLNLPASGAVRWDGVDTRDLDPRQLWRHTAVVPQEFARWPLSCRENIQLGQPAPDGDAAVLRAAAASGADEVVADLRSGLDTLLAREWLGGEGLSSGQWQRLAVARAFHRGGGLLVLDEPTSDLDARAEHRIFTGLRGIAADRPVVLVTHNLANTAVADRIIVLRHGRVVQDGTFQELTAAPGFFKELHDLQRDRGARRPSGGADPSAGPAERGIPRPAAAGSAGV